MAGQPTGWAYNQVRTGDTVTKAILAALADSADNNGWCNPHLTQGHLANILECHVSTIKRHLKKLENAGVLQVVRKQIEREKRRNLYRLRIETSFDLTGSGAPAIASEIGSCVLPISKQPLYSPDATRPAEQEKKIGSAQLPIPRKGSPELPIDEKGSTVLPIGKKIGGTELPISEIGSTQLPGKVADSYLSPEIGSSRRSISSSSTSSSTNYSDDDVENIPTDHRFRMHSRWQPSDEILESILRDFEIPLQYSRQRVARFANLHAGRGTTLSQGEFQTKFIDWVLRDWRACKDFEAEGVRAESLDDQILKKFNEATDRSWSQ